MGSPIRRLLRTFFSKFSPSPSAAAIILSERYTNLTWLNLYRKGDPIGTRLFDFETSITDEKEIVAHEDVKSKVFVFGPHLNYWDDQNVLEAIETHIQSFVRNPIDSIELPDCSRSDLYEPAHSRSWANTDRVLRRNRNLSRKTSKFLIVFGMLAFAPLILVGASWMWNPMQDLWLSKEGVQVKGDFFLYKKRISEKMPREGSYFIFVPKANEGREMAPIRSNIFQVPNALHQQVRNFGQPAKLMIEGDEIEYKDAKRISVDVEYLPTRPWIHRFPEYPKTFREQIPWMLFSLGMAAGLAMLIRRACMDFIWRYLCIFLGRRGVRQLNEKCISRK